MSTGKLWQCTRMYHGGFCLSQKTVRNDQGIYECRRCCAELDPGEGNEDNGSGVVPSQDLIPNDQCCYEIRIINRQTQQEHVFHADHHEINWERGRILNSEDCVIGFTGKERITIKAWRGIRSWSQFQPIEKNVSTAEQDRLELSQD